jgi:hypothetical protein
VEETGEGGGREERYMDLGRINNWAYFCCAMCNTKIVKPMITPDRGWGHHIYVAHVR